MLRVKAAVFAGAEVAIAVTFFPLWFAIPVAVLLAAWGLGIAVRAVSVVVDPGVGVLVLRTGLITRRDARAGPPGRGRRSLRPCSPAPASSPWPRRSWSGSPGTTRS